MQDAKNQAVNFENDTIKLNGRELTFKTLRKQILLTKRQLNLMNCLVNEINDKERIIDAIWGDGKYKNKENSYTQLIFKLRELFMNHGLPDDILVTLPCYGLCLHKELLSVSTLHRQQMAYIVNDHAAYL